MICCCCCRMGGRPAPRPRPETMELGVIPDVPGLGFDADDVDGPASGNFGVVEVFGSDLIATGVGRDDSDDAAVVVVGIEVMIGFLSTERFSSSKIFSSLMASAIMSFFLSCKLETEAMADARAWC